MTTPIERAVPALFEAIMGADEHTPTEIRLALLDQEDRHTFRQGAYSVLDSIDTNQLATVILRAELPGGIKVGHADKIAHAVIAWLTGDDQ